MENMTATDSFSRDGFAGNPFARRLFAKDFLIHYPFQFLCLCSLFCPLFALIHFSLLFVSCMSSYRSFSRAIRTV